MYRRSARVISNLIVGSLDALHPDPGGTMKVKKQSTLGPTVNLGFMGSGFRVGIMEKKMETTI